MKYLSYIAGGILGILFLMASIMFFAGAEPKMEFPEGSPIAHFMAALGPTGYMHFVKVFELAGGILVMIPRLRNIGLLLLGPVIINIVAFHVFVDDPKNLLNVKQMWMLYVIVLGALYLFGKARGKFAGLLN